MKTVIIIVLASLSLSLCAQESSSKSVDLFNGKDLSGWHMDVPELDNNPDGVNPFIVRNKKLVSLGTPSGHLITDEVYQDYTLVLDYKFVGEPGNCGVLVHASTPRALFDMFPKSMEVQLEHENAGDFWCIVEDITVPDMEKRRGPQNKWGIVEGKNRRIENLTNDSEKALGSWNHLVIVCLGSDIKVYVNNDLVNSGTNCSAKRGHIAIQAEGAEVEFRNIQLLPTKKREAISIKQIP